MEKLKTYFSSREDVIFAFLFGSQAGKEVLDASDWDIAVYFKPIKAALEWECQDREYPQEHKIWGDCIEILATDNVDLIVLNRIPASIAALAVKGLPLSIKDRALYLEFMLAVTRQAEDYNQTVKEYAQVYWRSSSLSEIDKNIINKRLIFLDSELKDAGRFRLLKQQEYESDNTKRREVERWIENLINAAIDISKTILASQKRPVPSTYREVLRTIGVLENFSKEVGEELANWAELRNILAHEYLDIRWKRIEDFIKRSEPYLKKLIESVKGSFLE